MGTRLRATSSCTDIYWAPFKSQEQRIEGSRRQSGQADCWDLQVYDCHPAIPADGPKQYPPMTFIAITFIAKERRDIVANQSPNAFQNLRVIGEVSSISLLARSEATRSLGD